MSVSHFVVDRQNLNADSIEHLDTFIGILFFLVLNLLYFVTMCIHLIFVGMCLS
jgi:hypothetical protein